MRLRDLLRARSLRTRLLFILSILGPGFITANVDNDAGGVATYTLAGAHFGNAFLWTMIPITVLLILVQELCARMAVATGKGLADLIRETYGLRATFYLMAVLVLANLGNVIAEFAGIAASLELFEIPKWASVPASAVFVWWLVTQSDYKRLEKVFLAACLLYLTYPLSAYMARPDWHHVVRDAFRPGFPQQAGALPMLVALIGATIAPWMQFYQQSSMVDKGLKPQDYNYAKWDVILGCIVTNVVAFFIIVACSATLFQSGVRVTDAAQAALSLKPLAGDYCAALFALGLLNASLFAACILPLSTAYSVCEGMGWQSGVNHYFEDAPQFYSLYTAIVGAGALVVLWPGFPLIRVMYGSQILNGLLLPVILFYCIRLAARKDIMGEHASSPGWDRVRWALTGLASLFSALTALSWLF